MFDKFFGGNKTDIADYVLENVELFDKFALAALQGKATSGAVAGTQNLPEYYYATWAYSVAMDMMKQRKKVLSELEKWAVKK